MTPFPWQCGHFCVLLCGPYKSPRFLEFHISGSMAGIAGDLLLDADIALAPVDAVQKRDGHTHRDIGPVVV